MANFAGKGTTLQVSINSSFVTISQNVEITGPSPEVGTREVTHLESSAREFNGTIVDSGTLTGNCLFDPTNAGQAYFQGKINTATPSTGESFKLIYSTTTKSETFTGIPTSWAGSGMTVDGTVVKEWGIKLSGLITSATTT